MTPADDRMPAGEPPAGAEGSVDAPDAPAEGSPRGQVASTRRAPIESVGPTTRADAAAPIAAAVPVEPARPTGGVGPAEDASAPGVGPRIAPPSDDVATAQTVALPGEHRGGFRRELTEPVPITATVRTDPDWAPETGPAVTVRLPRSAAAALAFGILGVIVSLVVGWGFPLGLVGAVLAIVALRRPWESRQAAVWGLCLSLVSLLYSAGWLWWASTQGPLFG